jgi:hypothetical protein
VNGCDAPARRLDGFDRAAYAGVIWRRLGSATLTASLVILLAGCGGGRHYLLAPTLGCLRAAGLKVSRYTLGPFDPATRPGASAIEIRLAGVNNDILIVFAKDGEQARSIGLNEINFASIFFGNQPANMPTKGNVIYFGPALNSEPGATTYGTTINGCLSASR